MDINTNQEIMNDQAISLKDVILNLKNWILFIKSRIITILIASIIGGLVAFLYGYFKKNLYIASTTFVLEESEKGAGLGQYAGLASMVGLDIGSSSNGVFQGDNIIEFYKSRAIIQKTLLSQGNASDRILLIERYIRINNLREKWKNPVLKSLNFSDHLNKNNALNRLKDSILASVVKDINKNYLTVEKPDKKLAIIRVEVKSNDEIFAKEFNDKLVKNVNDSYINTKTLKAVNNVKILQHKTDSVRNVMNGAIYSAISVSDATPNLNVTRQIQRLGPTQKYQYSAEANKAILTELVKNLELSKMSLLKETPLIEVIDAPILPLEIERTSKIKLAVASFILTGILTIIFLVIRRYINNVLNDQ